METPQPWSRNKNSSLLLNSQRVCYLFTKIFSTVTCLLSSESPQLAVLYPCSVVVSCCHSDDSLPHSHYHPVASSLFSVTFPLPPPNPCSPVSQSDASSSGNNGAETPVTLGPEKKQLSLSRALVTLEQGWWESFPTSYLFFCFFFSFFLCKSLLLSLLRTDLQHLSEAQLIRKKGCVWLRRDVFWREAL